MRLPVPVNPIMTIDVSKATDLPNWREHYFIFVIFARCKVPVAFEGCRTHPQAVKVSQLAQSKAVLWSKHVVARTINGHYEVMKQVGIAELKAHLSEYLRAARGGQTVEVLDRDIPVARIVPIAKGTGLRVRKPASGAPALNRVALPRPLKSRIEILDLLLEERQSYR